MILLALALFIQDVPTQSAAQAVADEAALVCRSIYNKGGDYDQIERFMRAQHYTPRDRLMFLTVCEAYMQGRVDGMRVIADLSE